MLRGKRGEVGEGELVTWVCNFFFLFFLVFLFFCENLRSWLKVFVNL